MLLVPDRSEFPEARQLEVNERNRLGRSVRFPHPPDGLVLDSIVVVRLGEHALPGRLLLVYEHTDGQVIIREALIGIRSALKPNSSSYYRAPVHDVKTYHGHGGHEHAAAV